MKREKFVKNISTKYSSKKGECIMLSKEKWNEIKHFKKYDFSQREVARKMEISRNTIRKYWDSKNTPQFKKRKKYKHKMDSFKKRIKQLLDKGFIGTVIYKKLKTEGFKGSLSSIYREIRRLEKRKKQGETRFETPPGKQAQYDWKEFVVKLKNGRMMKIYYHCLILACSRLKFYCFSTRIDQKTILRAIKQGYEYFGGVTEELLLDNAKAMVTKPREKGKPAKFNQQFLLFCNMLGVTPRACNPYRPKTKGKVERPFYYLQEHFLRDFASDEKIVESFQQHQKDLEQFTEEYNNRSHSDLGLIPKEAGELERKHLRPLNKKIDLNHLFALPMRKVSRDGYVRYGKRMYPVSLSLVSETVTVDDISGVKLEIRDEKGKCSATYFQDELKQRPEHPTHIIINAKSSEKRKKLTSGKLKKFVELFGDAGEFYFNNAFKHQNINAYHNISVVMEYLEIQSKKSVLEAIIKCNQGGYYKSKDVKDKMQLQFKDFNKAKIISSGFYGDKGKSQANFSQYRRSHV
ncbi:MAG: IS21 family transposase [Deltaproteobacteria bacterium]|nr:IS21 family transposase [Deltaproteobacteria bacterium]